MWMIGGIISCLNESIKMHLKRSKCTTKFPKELRCNLMKGCRKIIRKFPGSSDEFRSAKRVQNVAQKYIKTSEVMED